MEKMDDLKLTEENEDKRYDIDQDPVANIFSCGWLEDGRCGYKFDNKLFQPEPNPFRFVSSKDSNKKKRFVAKRISAGSRHTIILTINCFKELRNNTGQKSKLVMITGLNQVGLCETPGLETPVNIYLDKDEVPVDVVAGHGTSFVITRVGNVYSFGFGAYGVLGHGDTISYPTPRLVSSLERFKIIKIAAGEHHAMAITNTGSLLAWGRNHRGQLGLELDERECSEVLVPARVDFFSKKDEIMEVACGKEHTLALAKIVRKDNSVHRLVFAWGDHSRGQLGNGDAKFHTRPQEMRWLSSLLKRMKRSPISVAAGGFHNLVLTSGIRQVVTWGGGDYGQLGNGFMWDETRPHVVVGLRDVFKIAAGYRFSMALRQGASDPQPEVYSWGHNSYGELGLGDTDIRLQPTLVSAFDRARVIDVACGDRHTVWLTNHKPLSNREDPMLSKYFEALEEGDGTNIRAVLNDALANRGFDPSVLDRPNDRLPGQVGDKDEILENDKFEKGLRYCLDTLNDPGDWRRKTFETCFECPSLGLKTICLACARRCHGKRFLEPRFRRRNRGDICDCSRGPHCKCSWSEIRNKFDKVASQYVDFCIGPCDLRELLTELRHPALLDEADFQDSLQDLANGIEESDLPRIDPVVFEKWYKRYFEKYE